MRDVQLHSAETGALMGTVVGCLLAVLAALLPSCISALSRAQKMRPGVVFGRVKGGGEDASCFSVMIIYIYKYIYIYMFITHTHIYIYICTYVHAIRASLSNAHTCTYHIITLYRTHE